MQNTYQKGSVRLFIYPEGKRFVGVCLDLDIIEEGENQNNVCEDLIDAVKGHVETVIKNKFSEDLLNRPAPKEYWDKYNKFLSELVHKDSVEIKSPAEIKIIDIKSLYANTSVARPCCA